MMSRWLVVGVSTLLIAAVGCARSDNKIDEEHAAPAVDRTALDPAMAEAFRRAAHQQSKTIRGTTIVLHRACENVRMSDPNKPELKWLGVDFELQPLGEGFEGLDLRAIEARDGTTGKLLATVGSVQRLTDDARPADDADPIFAGSDKFRGMLVYEIPKACRTVNLEYHGEALNSQPMHVENCTVRLPNPSLKAVALAKRDVDKPAYLGYLVEIECHDWSRMATPRTLVLRSLAGDATSQADPDRFIELDENRKPCDSTPGNRPFYPDHRWFLVEFWCPRDAVPVDVLAGTEAALLPTDETPFPRDLLEALEQAPRLEQARHRRE
ncbi:MAG TPA: hypothetical protein VG713_13895 [Pirellulales bacterium]|nr:hypothetical protein [Pirellulales bacterium]